MNFWLFILAFICRIGVISGQTHSLQYFYTGTTAIVNFPEFVVVAIVDGEVIGHYDSNIRSAVPKQQWMECADSAHLDQLTGIGFRNQQRFKVNLVNLPKMFNQTEGIHTYQRIDGCELNEETGVIKGLTEFGYDGEDFLSLDTKTLTWTAANQRGVSTKLEWERNFYALRRKNYLESACIERLKKYVGYGRKFLERKVPPEVSLFLRDTLSPGTKTLLCLATGFFPRRVVVTWERDGQEVYEDVELGETVPNGDGTFQIRSTLRVSPEQLEKHKYTCTVQHSSLEDKVVRNWDPPSSNVPLIIGVAVTVMVLAVIAAGVVIVLRKRGPQTTSNTTKESGGAIYKSAPANEHSDGSSMSS